MTQSSMEAALGTEKAALAAAAKEGADEDELSALAGPGYRDMTRLASSPWGIWRDILATNSGEVADALDSLVNKLSAARDGLRGLSTRTFAGGEALAAARSLFGRVRPD